MDTPTDTHTTSRRWFLGAAGTTALVGGLAACGTSSTTSSSTATMTTAEAVADTTTSGSLVELAEAFAATLTDDQQTALQQDYTLANAENWSNFPNALLSGMGGGPGGSTSTSTGRVGVQTDTLSDEQWTAFEALMQAATGSGENEGWDEIQQILNADDYLDTIDSGGGYGSGNYFIAFLGTPADTGTWELQFGGHHLAFGNTYTDGALAGATPSFRGIEPVAAFDYNGRTNQPLAQELAAFTALLASFSTDQLATAKVSTSDLVLGPGQDWAFPDTYEGIVGSDLSTDQQTLVLAAIKTYVADISDAEAATILSGYEAELDETYVCWSGTGEFTTRGDYLRIDGPSVWIEIAMQNGIALSPAHVHSVWRDRFSDYGGTRS